MVKLPPRRFEPCFRSFTMLLVEGYSEMAFLDVYLTGSYGLCIFRNTLAMRVIFVWKCSKFSLDFKIAERKPEKKFSFWDNYIWIGFVKLSLLRTEYLSSAVNELTNSLNILHSDKSYFFKLNIFASDPSIEYRCCSADFNIFWARLSCCLVKGTGKRHLLDI